jgi:Protein of unknown function (DUF3768)
MTMEQKTKWIAELNDRFRKGDATLGIYQMTPMVEALTPEQRDRLIAQIQGFEEFTEEDDPYGEHDFGGVEVDGEKYFWKIDYLDPNMEYLSADPSGPNETRRVMTIMHCSEY